MLLKIETRAEDETLHVKLVGEFDLSSIDEFRDAVENADTPWTQAEIDMSDVVFMDSSGLQALVSLNNRAQERGLEVTLVRPSHPVCRLLALTGLESQFAIQG
jgi:anti-sigma B factor antagonist